MTLPAWALKIGADAVAALAEAANANPLPVDLAKIIAAEVVRFHAAQQPEQLLTAVAGVAALCAETEDGRLVTKEAVSPGDFLLRIKAVLATAATDITWRVAFIERAQTLRESSDFFDGDGHVRFTRRARDAVRFSFGRSKLGKIDGQILPRNECGMFVFKSKRQCHNVVRLLYLCDNCCFKRLLYGCFHNR